MSGHSHFSTIKRKKGAADEERGNLFSKLLSAVSIAARGNPDPQFNPQLRNAILRAKEYKVPQDNIDRAVTRASQDKNLEELLLEAYGPEGVAILIEAISDNKNRTIPEIKKILADHEAKWAEPGSVRWAFQPADLRGTETEQGRQDIEREDKWAAKFTQPVSDKAKEQLGSLLDDLLEHNDVQKVYTNS